MCSRPAWPIGRPAIVALQAAEELLRLLDPRLGQDHRELVAADAARDVGGADHLAHALGRLGEHGVAGEMADLVVHVLEVVEVEDDQGEPPVVAVRAGALARERLVEVPPVVEARSARRGRRAGAPRGTCGRSRSPASRGGSAPRARRTSSSPKRRSSCRASRRRGSRSGCRSPRAGRRGRRGSGPSDPSWSSAVAVGDLDRPGRASRPAARRSTRPRRRRARAPPRSAPRRPLRAG